MLPRNMITDVLYIKETGESSKRTVIVKSVPTENYRVIDVSDLDTEERQTTLQNIQDYNEYYNNKMSTVYSFEQFVEQKCGTLPVVKWRTFNKDRVELI